MPIDAQTPPTDPEDAAKQASILTSVMPRWLVSALALVAFGLFSAFLIVYLTNFADLQNKVESMWFARTMVAVFFAVYFAIFFFVFYPQRVVLTTFPTIDLTVRLVGPVALMLLLLYIFMNVLKADASFDRFEQDFRDFSTESRGARIFDSDGYAHDKLELTFRNRTIVVSPPEPEEFKEVERLYDESDGLLYIKSKRDVYLGVVEDPRDPNDDIRLGIYYGECLTRGDGCHRRDRAKAVQYIVRGVSHGGLADSDRSEVRGVLYYLMTEDAFTRCSDYTTLNEVLGPLDYHELAENHYKMYGDSCFKKHPQLEAIGRNALRHYLLFLSRALGQPEESTKIRGAIRAIDDSLRHLAREISLPDLPMSLASAEPGKELDTLKQGLWVAGNAQEAEDIVCSCDEPDRAR